MKPIYEQIVSSLISGKTIKKTAEKLEIDRSTIYRALQNPEVKIRFNCQLQDIKNDIENSLSSLYSKAGEAIKDCLESENDTIKLKTATWLIEKAGAMKELPTTIEELKNDEEKEKIYSENMSNILVDLQI